MNERFLYSTDERVALQWAAARAVHHEFANAFQVVLAHAQLGHAGASVVAASFQASALADLTARIACGVQHWADHGDLLFALKHSVEAFGPLCHAREIDVVLESEMVHDERSTHFPFPSWPVEAILVCLISNALKAVARRKGGKGKIRVRTQLVQDRLRIQVEDNGCGITRQDLRWIGQEGRSRLGGRGLGLAISRDISEQLGGMIGLTSHVDEGTRVNLVLPISADVRAAS